MNQQILTATFKNSKKESFEVLEDIQDFINDYYTNIMAIFRWRVTKNENFYIGESNRKHLVYRLDVEFLPKKKSFKIVLKNTPEDLDLYKALQEYLINSDYMLVDLS